ncbi:hypothetical protein F511_07804 [Dorcoceras hygrometricum]|uniref:Uncharacterized protein n=1 Tax=Dorcoceras hygrometricum TaxID=472368 RepID=A0A2Z7CJU8_9LAMI|nr:hypothetical protein F511_07804 [Dorcoceras hygrometricum]
MGRSSAVNVVISKEIFVDTFQLPYEGIVYFTNPPAKAMADMSGVLDDWGPVQAFQQEAGHEDQRRNSSELGARLNILATVVSMAGKQSCGYDVQLSLLLEKLVKMDLGESVALHLLKVLNTNSVHTYKLKTQASAPKVGGEKKRTGDRAEAAPELWKKKKDAEQYGSKQPAEEESQLTCGPCLKRKMILASSDSEPTTSMELLVLMKRRSQRLKKITTISAIPAGAAQAYIPKAADVEADIVQLGGTSTAAEEGPIPEDLGPSGASQRILGLLVLMGVLVLRHKLNLLLEARPQLILIWRTALFTGMVAQPRRQLKQGNQLGYPLLAQDRSICQGQGASSDFRKAKSSRRALYRGAQGHSRVGGAFGHQVRSLEDIPD